MHQSGDIGNALVVVDQVREDLAVANVERHLEGLVATGSPAFDRLRRLLEAIEQKKTTSQRDLAKALDVSLGLVNSFVRRLAKKGYFKVTHLPRNRIRYILTPKGAAEKSRLTYAYIRFSYQFYRDARRKIKNLFINLQSHEVRSVAFFGTGDLAEIAYLSLQETNIRFAGIGDMTDNGSLFFGHKVVGIETLQSIDFDVVVITHDQSYEDLIQRLIATGIDAQNIKRL